MALNNTPGFGRGATGKGILVPKVRESVQEEEEEQEVDVEQGPDLDSIDATGHELLNFKPELVKLLNEIDDYQLLIPDSVVKYHLERTGCKVDAMDTKIVRLISLAAQKFATKLTADALNYSVAKKPNSTDRTLAMEDLSRVLKDEGIYHVVGEIQ